MSDSGSLESHPIRLYVTTGITEPDDYSRLFEYLESARGFFYKNVGTSPLAPIKAPGQGATALRDSIRGSIAQAEIVVALAELEISETEMLKFQIGFAQTAARPVLLLPHFGSPQAPSRWLASTATEAVEWNERSMTDAILRLARGQDTHRWETIDFKLD